MKLYYSSFMTILIQLLSKPMWLMLIFSLSVMSLVYGNGSMTDLPIGVIDQDHSKTSRQLIRDLDATSIMSVKIYTNEIEAHEDLILRNLFAVIVIPINMEKRILQGNTVTIAAYGDATSRIANGLLQSDVTAVYLQLLTDINQQILLQDGRSIEEAKVMSNPMVGQIDDLFNPGINLAAITFPALVVMLLQHSLLLAGAQVLITLDGMKKPNTPPLAVYLGALSGLLPIWLFLSIILLVLWPWVLGYRQIASIGEILILTLIFLFSVLALCKFLISCIHSVEKVYLTLSLITTPVFYISGAIWPFQVMPFWVNFFAHLIPSVWATKIIVSIDQMGLSVEHVYFEVSMLVVLMFIYGFLGLWIAKIRSKKSLPTLSQ